MDTVPSREVVDGCFEGELMRAGVLHRSQPDAVFAEGVWRKMRAGMRFTGLGDMVNVLCSAPSGMSQPAVVHMENSRFWYGDEQMALVRDCVRHKHDRVRLGAPWSASMTDPMRALDELSSMPTSMVISEEEREMLCALVPEVRERREKRMLVVCPNEKKEAQLVSWTPLEWMQLIRLWRERTGGEVVILPHFGSSVVDGVMESLCVKEGVPVRNLHKAVARNERVREMQHVFGEHSHPLCSLRQFGAMVHVLSRGEGVDIVCNDSGLVHIASAAAEKDAQGVNRARVVAVNMYERSLPSEVEHRYTPRNGGYSVQRLAREGERYMHTQRTDPVLVAGLLVGVRGEYGERDRGVRSMLKEVL